MLRRLAWRLRLCLAIPMVVVGCWLEDVGLWLVRWSYRVEGEEP